jgi:hypothetical protein
MSEQQLCQRTHCLWKPGQPVEGMFCHYVYAGAIPCTGPQRCIFCGKTKPIEGDDRKTLQ